MATLESIKNKLQNLINASNETTGNSDVDLTSAVNALLAGYMRGESAEFYRYLTFMGVDYETVAKVVSVAPKYSSSSSVGPALTKESTVDTVFTLAGWSLSQNGEVDSSVFSNITKDLILYPIFTESVRTYKVRFWDGEVLLKTVQVPYGESSDYTYHKTGARFHGWTPEPTNIVADLDCYGSWEFASFATDSWAQIAEYARAGTASEYYDIGDDREIVLSNGERIALQLASYKNSRGNTGIRIVARNALANSKMLFTERHSGNSEFYNWYGFNGSKVYTYLHEQVLPMLPEDLQDVLRDTNIINEVARASSTNSEYGLTCKLYIPTCWEVCGSHRRLITGSNQEYCAVFTQDDPSTDYTDIFGNDASEKRVVTLADTGEPVRWWTRTPAGIYKDMYVVNEDGSITDDGITNEADAYVVFAFDLF